MTDNDPRTTRKQPSSEPPSNERKHPTKIGQVCRSRRSSSNATKPTESKRWSRRSRLWVISACTCLCLTLAACGGDQPPTARGEALSGTEPPTSETPRPVEVLLAEPERITVATVVSRLMATFDFVSTDGTPTPTRRADGVVVYRHPSTSAEVQVDNDGFVRFLARGHDAPTLPARTRHQSAELITRSRELFDRLGIQHSGADGFRFSRTAPGTPAQPNSVIVTRLVRNQPIVLTGRSPLEVRFDDSFNVDRIELALWTFKPLTKVQPLRPIEVFGSDPINYAGMDWVASQLLAAIPIRARDPRRWAVVPAWDPTIPGWGPALAITAKQLGDVQALANERP